MSKQSNQIKKLCDIAQALNEKEWKELIGSLDKTSRSKLQSALEKKSDVLKRKSVKKSPKSPVPKKSKQKAAEDDANTKDRKISYKFGSRTLHVIKPSTGYPSKAEIDADVKGKLELTFSHGYSGNFEESRQNIYLTPDGTKILYFIAAVCIVYEYKKSKQKFFTKHNDDITALCIAPLSLKKPYAASGQKDPKDEPGKGKDLPKVYIWNYKTMKTIKLIDKVCWGKIHRLQWSGYSKILYCICGDDDQTLKAWDPSSFEQKKKPCDTLIEQNTLREKLLGFEINNKVANKDIIDEMVLFGKRKFCFVTVTKGKKDGKLSAKIKSVSITALNSAGEKSFGCAQFFDDGVRYAVGSQSGAIYIGKGQTAIAIVKAHEKSIGCMARFENRLITASFDKLLKEFAINADDSGKGKDKKKETAQITEKWSSSCEVKESDFILQPRAMAINGKTNEFFIGTKTNQICLFEQKTKDSSVVVDGHDGQVWALVTHPKETNVYATGGYDNAVKLWDAKTLKCTFTFEYDTKENECDKQQLTCAAWSNDGNYVAFGSEQSCVSLFKYTGNNTLELLEIITIPPKSKNAEIEGVSYLRFSEDSTLLGCAHMDSNMYMFTLEDGKLIKWNAMNHIAAPINVQFSEGNKFCKSFTRDYEIVHWKLDTDKKKAEFYNRTPDPDTLKWVDDPLIAGWDVQGLYQKGWDGTDLNDATLTNDGKFVVSGDDYGTIRLHNYPAINRDKCLEYGGHAEFVVGVEFLRDDSMLISCGGNDMAIFQWTLTKQ